MRNGVLTELDDRMPLRPSVRVIFDRDMAMHWKLTDCFYREEEGQNIPQVFLQGCRT